MAEKTYFSVSFPSIKFYFSEDPAWLKANGMAPIPEIKYQSDKPLFRYQRPAPEQKPTPPPQAESKPESPPEAESKPELPPDPKAKPE